MISRYSATLNNVSLASLDSSILILDIKYKPTEVNDKTFQLAKRHGTRFHERYFGTNQVTVVFEIHKYSISEREAVRSSIVKWAKNGGTLEVNDRPNQRLECICTSFPTIESVRNWTDPLSITFAGNGIPFWYERLPVTITLSGTSNTGTLVVPGDVDGALVECEVRANSYVSSFSLGVNGRLLTLSGLSLASGNIVRVRYSTTGIQSITQGSTSLLDKRTGVDDLLAKCGQSNSFSIGASASIQAMFSVKGWWL